MEALGQFALRAFEDEMVVHLTDFSPPLAKAVKEDQLREAIRFGIMRAGEYGITFRGPVRLYLELMLVRASSRMANYHATTLYPLAREKVRYVGEPVVVVLAENRYLAEDARDRIEIAYEALAIVIDPEIAGRADAPLLHVEAGTNVLAMREFARGDIGAEMTAAPMRVGGRFRFHRKTPIAIEKRLTRERPRTCGIGDGPTPDRSASDRGGAGEAVPSRVPSQGGSFLVPRADAEEFAADSLLEEAVLSELVSEAKFPASWENTGNFIRLDLRVRLLARNPRPNSMAYNPIPYASEQGIYFGLAGN
jgi:Aldehyde oxidase and xanthine dehydrogenase, a/b hammerhead domain